RRRWRPSARAHEPARWAWLPIASAPLNLQGDERVARIGPSLVLCLRYCPETMMSREADRCRGSLAGRARPQALGRGRTVAAKTGPSARGMTAPGRDAPWP